MSTSDDHDDAELTQKELREIRADAKKIIDALEKDHEEDLSRHLYAAYATKQKRTQAGLKPFPTPRWTQWPISDIRKSTHVHARQAEAKQLLHEDRAIVPNIDQVYTKVEDPRELPTHSQASAVSVSSTTVENHYRPDLENASNVLNHELDAAFKRNIYRKIHRDRNWAEKLVPVVTPDCTLPAQSRQAIFSMVNRVLDNLSTGLPSKGISTKNWADVVHHDARVGKTVRRCKRLFPESIKNDHTLKMLNLSSNDYNGSSSLFINPNKSRKLDAKDRALAASCDPAIANQNLDNSDELLGQMLIPLAYDDRRRPEYKRVGKLRTRGLKKKQLGEAALAQQLQKPPLELIDKKLNKRLQSSSSSSSLPDDEFYVEPTPSGRRAKKASSQ